MKVLLLDNYDSFTFNLYHYLEDLGCSVTVIRNDEADLESIKVYDRIILSPGPGLPEDAGIMMELIERYVTEKPILGVCLGMQALGLFFNGKLFNQTTVKHGISETCIITRPASKLFKEIPESFQVGLYHSWAVDLSSSEKLVSTSVSENNILMSCEHADLPVFGVQFHPESILTQHGKKILLNFLNA